MEIKKICRSENKKGDPELVKKMMKELRKEHDKMVKGKFEFIDAQGGWLEFAYRFFPEDLLVTYKFYHDEVCEIPMGMVKHINNTVKKIRTFGNTEGVLPERGLPSAFTTQSRIRFTPLEMF